MLWRDGLDEVVEDFVELGGGAFSLHALTPQPPLPSETGEGGQTVSP